MSRPVDLDVFRRLDLRVGTVLSVSPLLEDLAAVAVLCPETLEALVPFSCLPPDPAGARVVVAVGLRPLAIGARRFTAILATAEGSLVQVAAEISDGSRLT